MAEGIVYLDVDDEITSAASRIRTAQGSRLALVVPYGSRIATSRMNFRLLSREAVVSNHRLSIVSNDPAARSLAASAGLPVFGTVAEYQGSMATAPARAAADESSVARAETDADADEGPGILASTTVAAVSSASGTALEDSATVVAAPPIPAADTASDAELVRRSQRPQRPPADGATATGGAAAPRTTVGRGGSADLADDTFDDVDDRPAGARRRVGAPAIVALGLLVLALIVAGVAGYLFLPSATITVTPRRESVGPIPLTVLADPEATAPDPVGLVVPAVRVEVPVEAAKTFTTTGKHVEEASARGSVTFTNYDTSSGVSIPSGSIVSTEGGVRFRTQGTVALQPASVFPGFEPTTDSTNVVAVKAGEGGNVPANTIRVVPEGQDPVLLRVNNPASTSGGSHTETPEVKKAEVEKAVAELTVDLRTAFDDAIAAGTGVPEGTTLFPTTAVLGAITPDVDPTTLIGQAVESYDLRLTAKGTVIAVDPTPVRAIAESQLASHVAAGHTLVEGSTKIDVGDGLVGEDGEVSFLASASAMEVTDVDADAMRQLVKGKSAEDARAALARFGDVTVTLWPDWVSTVPTVDTRLTVTIATGPGAGSGAGPSSRPSAAPSRRPSASGSRPPSARPSPAGSGPSARATTAP